MDKLGPVLDEGSRLSHDELGGREHDTVRSDDTDLPRLCARGHGRLNHVVGDSERGSRNAPEGDGCSSIEVVAVDIDDSAHGSDGRPEACVRGVVLLLPEDGHEAVRGEADTPLVENLDPPDTDTEGTREGLVFLLQRIDLLHERLVPLGPWNVDTLGRVDVDGL